MPGSILSYSPSLKADENMLLVSNRPLNQSDMKAVSKASAVILPLLCRQDLHLLVTKEGKPHFPSQGVRLHMDGKVGNAALFKALALPHPPTLTFRTLAEMVAFCKDGGLSGWGLEPPLVVKGAGGGEGRNVFLVRSLEEMAGLEGGVDPYSAHGPSGLVLQKYIECEGRDARVVFIGDFVDVFWRIGAKGEFRTNLSQGGTVDRNSDPGQLARVLELAERLRVLTHLDVAAVDILMPPHGEPMLLEINHYFGRRALGGEERFEKLMLGAVRNWAENLGLNQMSVMPG